VDDQEVEHAAMQNTMDTTCLLLKQKEKEVDQMKNEVKMLQGENALIKSYKTSLQGLEEEKSNLVQQLSQMQLRLAESQANANVVSNLETNTGGDSNSMVTSLKTDKESLESQVEFLNSVIVDMQHKNEEQSGRLQALEAGRVMNGSSEYDIEKENDSSHRKPAPRLFCDICDVFDLHDTDDCPQQAMSESPPASLYHGDRTEERPYCDICEVFGHWTSDCDDEQTF
jgi:CAP-Gly domain-containing linker protein 1